MRFASMGRFLAEFALPTFRGLRAWVAIAAWERRSAMSALGTLIRGARVLLALI